MAITQTYVDYAAGNDYTGATFTDGSFANATLTLTKVGAFAAVSPDHWLYLDDNGSGEVTTGYYKIASKTSNDAVVLASDIRSGANDPTDVKCTQHDGTSSLPYRSLQGAFDLITRNSSDGDQVNLKAGTAQVNVTTLTLDEYGTPTEAAPLIIRGYTSSAGDGGIGEIDANGASLWTGWYDYIHHVDLEMHSFGNNHGLQLTNCLLYHCEIHKGASTPSGKYLCYLNTYGRVEGCYFHDIGDASSRAVYQAAYAYGNYVLMDTDVETTGIDAILVAENNIVLCQHTGASGISSAKIARFNSVYNTASGTSYGINVSEVAENNICVGFSGVGGKGILATNIRLIGWNAFYNCTSNYSISDQKFIDLSANDVALGADPFTDAADGDFSLTAAGKTALRGLGWPGAYLGAHANTDGHITIGAIQYGEAEASGGANPMHGKLG